MNYLPECLYTQTIFSWTLLFLVHCIWQQIYSPSWTKVLTYKLEYKISFNILYPIASEVPQGSILGPMLFSFHLVSFWNQPIPSERFLRNPLQNYLHYSHFMSQNIQKTSQFPNLYSPSQFLRVISLRDCIYTFLNSLTTPND